MSEAKLHALASALADFGMAFRSLTDSTIQVADAFKEMSARTQRLEAALQPFADWYRLQRLRQGPTFEADDKSLCFCTRQGTDGIGTRHLRAASDVLAERD